MQRILTCLFIVVLAVSAACGQDRSSLEYTGSGELADFGPLPDLPRLTSATELINGVDYLTQGPGTTEAPPALEFDATGLPCAWALYGYGLVDGLTLNNLAVDVESVTGEYWVGLSNYADGSWEFRGPYTDDCLMPLAAAPEDYLSPEDNFHWVVVAEPETTLTLISSTVWTTGTPLEVIYFVPPAGKHTIFAGPASDPYLILMDSTCGTAEDGAPVILYTADNAGEPDTWLAWYNGTDWESRLLSTEDRYTHAMGYWDGEDTLFFAHYYGTGGIDPSGYTRLRMDPTLNITSTYVIGSYNRYPGCHDLAYRPETNSYALIYACNSDPACVNIRYSCAGINGDFGDFGVPDAYDVVDVEIMLTPDATGGWAMYVYSQPDADQKVHYYSVIRYMEFNGTIWTAEPTNYILHDEIVGLDLHYTTAGDPEMLLLCARNYELSVPPELDFTTTLYQDVILGTYTGSDWDFTTLFTGTIDDSNKAAGELGPDIGIDIAWAGEDMLCYTTGAGTVTFTGDPEFHYTGGTLTVGGSCLARNEGVFEPSTYFAEAPGLCYSWAEGADGPACAYLETAAVDFSSVATCEVYLTEGALVYWAPGQ